MSLIADKLTPGFGSTNDGNTARQFENSTFIRVLEKLTKT